MTFMNGFVLINVAAYRQDDPSQLNLQGGTFEPRDSRF